MVTYMDRLATGVNDGRRHGAGSGFSNMQWLQSVRPGDTLTYTNEVIDKPEKVLRNRWSIIRSRNEAFNQAGELVFCFNIDILTERNPIFLSDTYGS